MLLTRRTKLPEFLMFILKGRGVSWQNMDRRNQLAETSGAAEEKVARSIAVRILSFFSKIADEQASLIKLDA